MLEMNDKQVKELSKLFMDLGKGLCLALFTTQFSGYMDNVLLIKFMVTIILCVVVSLKLLEPAK